MVSESGGWDPNDLIHWTDDFLDEYKKANAMTRVEGGSPVVPAWPP